jgi:hypothetical protein
MSYFFGQSPADFLAVAQTYWIIPAGLLALYFYGRFHFNSLEYAIDFGNSEGPAESIGARLLTPAPPIFTTSRTRYNSFARQHVLILGTAFLAMVFFPNVLAEAITLLTGSQFSWSKSATLQHKAMVALFTLTGLLSSFPGFKDLDRWLLRKLHRAAFIPDEARMLADRLYNAEYSPSQAALTAVRPTLSSRDDIRAAGRSLKGALEQRLIAVLCLRTQLQSIMADGKFTGFRIKLDRDLREVANQSQGLRAALSAYLRDQEKLVPADVPDIDAYISANIDKREIAQLAERRGELQARCDKVYETLCLLTALSMFATEPTLEDMNRTLGRLGFNVSVPPIPLLDWDAVARVVGSMFVILLMVNLAYAGMMYLRGLDTAAALIPDRARIIGYSLIFTLNYSIVMILAIKLKRKWRLDGTADHHRPENLQIALAAYAVSLAFTIPFSISMRGELTIAPFLYASSQAVLGYFIGIYVDRTGNSMEISYPTAAWQGALQLAATLIASLGSPPLPGTTWNLLDVLAVNAFVAVQSALSGFLIGLLFQHFHKRTAPLGEATHRLKNRDSDLLKEQLKEERAAAVLVNGSKPARNDARETVDEREATKVAVETKVEATLVPSDQQSAVAEWNQDKTKRWSVVP